MNKNCTTADCFLNTLTPKNEFGLGLSNGDRLEVNTDLHSVRSFGLVLLAANDPAGVVDPLVLVQVGTKN